MAQSCGGGGVETGHNNNNTAGAVSKHAGTPAPGTRGRYPHQVTRIRMGQSLVTIIFNRANNEAYLGWNCQVYFRISPEIGIFSVRLLVSKSLVLIREMNYATSSSTEPCSPTDLFRTFFVLVHFILHCNIKNSLLQRTLSIVPIFRNGNQVFPVVQQLHL